MLQYSEVSGWLALFIAIVHYKELLVENAIAAARGYYIIKIEKEEITQAKIDVIHNRGLNNITKLERELKLDRRTIIKISNVKHFKESDMEKYIKGYKSSFICNENEKEKVIKKINIKAKRYWDTFDVGQNIISITRVDRTNVVVRGNIITKKSHYLSVSQKGRVYTIGFSDIVSGVTRIKHTSI